MGFVAMKCPSCGANIELDETREFGFCNYCGTKVMQEKTIIEHRGNVRIDGPIKIDGPVKIVDNKYVTLFSEAKNLERLYYKSPEKVKYGNEFGYRAVVACYNVAEKAGGSGESEYWETFADFFIKANLIEYKKNKRLLANGVTFLKDYEFYMDNAIEYATDLQEEKRMQKKKEQVISELEVKLESYLKRMGKANKLGAIFTLVWIVIGAIALLIICGGLFAVLSNH